MPQVNSLGTGGTFMQDAKRFGLDGLEVANSTRWYVEQKPKGLEGGQYKYDKGRDRYAVEFVYRPSNASLSCMKIARI
jgi:hypothetical protein